MKRAGDEWRKHVVSKRGERDYRFVEKAECGLWVEPENPAALALYRDPDRRERLGRNGRARVEARYTPQVVERPCTQAFMV